jgi:hypothetical protein
VYAAIAGEEKRQRNGIELIPSENYTYPEVLAALGSVLTSEMSSRLASTKLYEQELVLVTGPRFLRRGFDPAELCRTPVVDYTTRAIR